VAIATGKLRAWEQLPTVRQLAVDLKINANTVAKVYGELERAGVLETRRGVGTFVRDVGGSAVARSDRERQMTALGDRYLSGAADLGFSAEEAIEFLEKRRRQGSTSDGSPRSWSDGEGAGGDGRTASR
jgi:GntR family transcriptional regulator